MLRALIQKAMTHHSTIFFLEVRESNHGAIALYHSEGFNESGMRKNYYPAENGREHAILMSLDLSFDVYT
jgi:ribosomal protein S18 acetylase RimI-like enzyme